MVLHGNQLVWVHDAFGFIDVFGRNRSKIAFFEIFGPAGAVAQHVQKTHNSRAESKKPKRPQSTVRSE